MLSLHDIFDKIKTIFFRNWSVNGQVRWRNTPKKKYPPPPKKNFSWGGVGMPLNPPSMFGSLCNPQPVIVIFS